MKRIKTRLLALLLSCCLVTVGTITPCRQAQAAEVVAGMETARWIISIAASAGFTVELAHLVGKSRDEVKDWDSYDWGNLLDDPATQKQIDDADKKIEEYYNNAVKDWYVKHGGQLSPSPAPTTTPQPPVTVAPIDPDTVEPPIDWDALKKKTEETGILSMVGATLACMREGLAMFWDDIVNPVQVDKELSDDVKNIIKNSGFPYYMYTVYYPGTSMQTINLLLGQKGSYRYSNRVCSPKTSRLYRNGKLDEGFLTGVETGYNKDNFKTNIPEFSSYKEGEAWSNEQLTNAEKDIPKAAIIPDLTRKQTYDNNSSIGGSTSSGSGSSPGSDTDNPFNFKIPTIDEIKDFLKDLMGGDEDDQPAKVTNFITNHTVQPTPAPNPTTAPSPGGGGSGGGTTDPDNPDSDDTDLDNYKADLRDVFPFCIPFDLIHLLNVLDAEPEAPVFKIPIDLEAGNPFTGDKIVDYHSEMVIDLSDYDDAIKVIRILEIIAFLLGLMLITRQQMIKG